MKKIWKYIIMLSFVISEGVDVIAQNLVPNWSFEDTVSCPTMLNQMNYAIGWNSFRESPDYFNSCASPGGFSNPSIPLNSWGFQYANTGNAYSGFTTYSNSIADVREFLGTLLNQSLIIGQKYFVSFFVSRAVNINVTHMNIATNNIGIRFSTNMHSITNPVPIDNYAQINFDSIISDTSNWFRISGSFIADSAYNYISIGNFFSDSLTSYIRYDSTANYAYYYVDDIRISTDSDFVNSIIGHSCDNNSINIFPNPAHNWIVVEGKEIKSIFLYDILGIKCIEHFSKNSFQNKIDLNNLSRGNYFIKINSSSFIYVKKIIIN